MSRRKSGTVTTKASQELISPELKLSTIATWACVHCSFSRGIDGSLVLLNHLRVQETCKNWQIES